MTVGDTSPTSTNGLTVTTSTGTAVTLNNVGGTFTFYKITSNGGGGSTDGISLVSTTGSFTVTGDGTNANSGGVISGKTGSDGSTTNGIGIYLSSAQNVSLSYMDIEGCQNYGIRGSSVTNFSMTNCTVGTTGTNGTSNTADTDASGYSGEGSVRFYNLLGTCSMTNCQLDKGFSKTLAICNTSGTLTNLTLSGCTINDSLGSGSSDAVYFQTQNSGTFATLTVTNLSASSTPTCRMPSTRMPSPARR